MILVVDNYDSFTYNLVRYLVELGQNVKVIQNNEWSLAEVKQFAPTHLILSPGPKGPQDAGISIALVQNFAHFLPILGVCLGHQCIGEALGGEVVRADSVMHGKTSLIHHTAKGLFKGIPDPFVGARYHSLLLRPDHLPKELNVTAWTAEKDIMGIQHQTWPLAGVQFHPEAILSEHGHTLLSNFLNFPEAQWT